MADSGVMADDNSEMNSAETVLSCDSDTMDVDISTANTVPRSEEVDILIIDKGTQCTIDCEWNEDDKKLIAENISYYQAMLAYCNELMHNKKVDKLIPKQPKVTVSKLLHPKTKAVLNIEKMHNHLVSMIVRQTDNSKVPDISTVTDNTTLEMMKSALKAGYNCLMRKQKVIMRCSIQYGKWLEAAAVCFKREKKQGKYNGKLAAWLNVNIGISDSYARQLREVARIFGDYPKIACLGMPFKDFYKDKSDIIKVITHESNIAFWSS
jgi:hypothetical protein